MISVCFFTATNAIQIAYVSTSLLLILDNQINLVQDLRRSFVLCGYNDIKYYMLNLSEIDHLIS